ncbi:MAG: hypothetical protein M1835_005502 [Candelina submexicana]|nr:MAG: hypothetical protein M1835_005502 [Candelina submexicana]
MAKPGKHKLETEQDSPAPKAKKPRASRVTKITKAPSTALSGVSDYEEDPGRIESQEFLARTKAISKRQAQKQENSVIEFREKIQAQQDSLLQLIEEKKEEISMDETVFLSNFHTLVSTALLSGSYAGDQKQAKLLSKQLPSDTTPTARNDFRVGQFILNKARVLVDKYDNLSESIQNIENSTKVSLPNTWEDEGKEMERILEVGRRATQGQINEFLERRGEGGKKKFENAFIGSEDKETLKLWELGQGVPDVSSKAPRGPGLFKALEQAKRGGRKLLKGLAVDED